MKILLSDSRADHMKLQIAAFLLGAAAANVAVGADDRHELWRIVHEQCVPHMERFMTPLPCVAVAQSAGYAILKDRTGESHFLLVPTARLSGIDDPALTVQGAPNYWQAAWESTRLVQAMVGRALPRDALSLAINSAQQRTQDQLHIHIDCVSPSLRAALREHGHAIGDAWAPFPVQLEGKSYRAIRARTLMQPGATPFELLARLADARADMAAESLVVVGADFGDGETGFYLIEARAGGGEELQDRGCAVAKSP